MSNFWGSFWFYAGAFGLGCAFAATVTAACIVFWAVCGA